MTTPRPYANDRHNYTLKIAGQLDPDIIAAYCPPETTLQYSSEASLLENIHTDQSGILGLVRHLHNLGCTILALDCQPVKG